MVKYKIIGNMTGNSMDAIDLVLTEFDNDIMTDICAYSQPYGKNMQERIENLRRLTYNKTREEIMALPEFKPIHDDYIKQIASCINHMCAQNNIDKKTIDAIGFHGKTLDHNPPSKAQKDGSESYTLQIGSGQMLADLTQIPVVYDFRSDYLMNGFEGAPLVSPHNAHISASEGDGCYYNGGNTSNFALIINGKAKIGSDAGPFNEYTDNYIRINSNKSFDFNGNIGKKGKLNIDLLQTIFDYGRIFYETDLPKSGDPAYYHKSEIFKYAKQQNISFYDAVHTFEYAAAYIAAYTLTLVPNNIALSNKIILFGGGWKNLIVKESFANLMAENSYVLPEHKLQFSNLKNKFIEPLSIKQSAFGDYMEARLFADLARYKLENKVWEIPEIIQANKKIVCGIIANPQKPKSEYYDCINRAAKGWQRK
ncbi:MAG: anhydro-N-acetylmuramic acid kinase [Alphaproteobacteria bacterium]|nr:anhydro-N-acetylmuramic acid kinase [Alphaproteobacteria bacterium]